MAIPQEHSWRYIFHFTDIRNLDSIIKHGLLCTNLKNEKGIKHQNIANMTIQERRANMDVPVGYGGKVHDYVPFYFSSINPMLLSKLNQKNVDQPLIIYLCVKIDRLEKDDAVFTSASANTSEPPVFYDDVVHLNDLSWDMIDSWKWKLPTEEDKHKKMAEALIYDHIGIDEVDAIVVFNSEVRKEVERIFKDNHVKAPAILYDHDSKIKKYSFYYTKFFIKDREKETLVVGPEGLLDEYHKLIDYIKSERQKKKDTYPYKTIKDLVVALDKNFSTLAELKDVEGLLQDYEPHNDTVDDHTKKVVSEMRQQDYFKSSSEEKKNILLLASYLHDMGKGPKNKWKQGKMAGAYLDHPLDAIPMLARVFTEEIENLSDEEIRLACMLVVYHDIVGDCMMKERDKSQIVRIMENDDDLDMLFAIAYADVEAIRMFWGLDLLCKKATFFKEIKELKQGL